MAKQMKKTVKKRKANKSTVKRKKTVKAKKLSNKSPTEINRAAHLQAYHELQRQVDRAWETLQTDVKKNAPLHVLIRDKNKLLLLLGECNYMARECMKYSS